MSGIPINPAAQGNPPRFGFTSLQVLTIDTDRWRTDQPLGVGICL